MSNLLDQSFGAELRRIETGLAAAATPQSPETGLAHHAFRIALCDPPVLFKNITQKFPDGAIEDAPQIASAGFVLKSINATKEQLNRWHEGLRRLTKREVFPRDHQTFVFRPAELVGIALGIQVTERKGSVFYEWLVKVLTRLSSKQHTTIVWNAIWSGYTASLFGVTWTHPLPTKFIDLETPEIALLLLLLNGGQELTIAGITDFNRADLERELLRRIALAAVEERQVDRLAVLHAALSLAIHSQLERQLSTTDGLQGGTRGALQILELICRNFDRFVRALETRHANRAAFEINDEYDVQDLVHGLLLLHFKVVIPEDHVPARAGNRSRLDFLLKRERVVVETKMTRKNLGQSEAHDELVADRDRYKSHPDCDVLVCLVYDPQHFFHNAPAFELDLNNDKDHPGMRAFVCPQ